MAILQQLQRWMSGLLPTRQDQSGAIQRPDVLVGTEMQYIPFGGPAVYPDYNIITYVNLFVENWAVYTIVSRIARRAASVPMYEYKIEDQSAQKQLKALRKMIKPHKAKKLYIKSYGEQIEETDMTKLINQPNPCQGRDQFFEQLFRYYETCGEVFIWLNRGDYEYDFLTGGDLMAPIYEMIIIPAQYVELIPNPDNAFGILGYRFKNGGKYELIGINDMIHWKMPTVEFDAYTRIHLRGLSPLKPGLKPAEQVDALTDAQVSMAQNDGAKGVLYRDSDSTSGKLSPIDETTVRTTIDRKINNRNVKGAVAFLGGMGKWGYHQFGQTGEQMQLNEAMDGSFVRLSNLFGVSPNLFMPGSTFDNVKHAQRDLITNVLCPALESLCGELNKKLPKAFNTNTILDIDITELPEMQDDMGTLVTSLQAAYWLSPNEKREAMNEEESPDPNMDKIYIPTTLTPLDDLNINLDNAGNYGTPPAISIRQ